MSFRNDEHAISPLLTEFQTPPPSRSAAAFAAAPDKRAATDPFDAERVRRDFPILDEHVNGCPLVWLDNAATTQKPRVVIDRLARYYERENSNVHRAAHTLAARATDVYEAARETVRAFINAASTDEVVFVRGATEGINLVAKSWGEDNVGAGDEIVVSHLEHHANIVPWQQLAAKKGARLVVIPVDDDGTLLLDEFASLIGPRTKIVAVTQISNALGTITPTRRIVELAHAAGAKVLIDAAQSVAHLETDVRALGADWLVFSGHKVFGPTGIGVLYGREELFNATSPWQGGGTMIREVTFEHTRYNNASQRFEAGTANIAGAVGLAAALEYLQGLGLANVARHERELLEYAIEKLGVIAGVRIVGNPTERAGVVSFVVEGIENAEVGRRLDARGIAVRAGHHCAQPILRRFGLDGTVRASFGPYNTRADVDALAEAVREVVRLKVK